jgi:hypothetical protein
MSYYNKNANRSALEILFEDGAIDIHSQEQFDEVQVLVNEGIAICCDSIPHHPYMINPSYVYVLNNEDGHNLALQIPLFTRVL